MKGLSKKEMALIIIPIMSGIIFVATVFINHALFESQIINARQAIGHEITIFLLGFVATIIQFPFAVKWLLKKKWKPAAFCLTSAVVFWGAIMFGSSRGAAMFWAT